MNSVTSNRIRGTTWACAALALTLSCWLRFVAFGAEEIPSERKSDVMFVGQVLCSELVESITNVVKAEYGLYSVDELHVARVRVESVIKHDQPIPLRFPDEVSVYYYWNKWQTCPRPARLASWERNKFYCYRHNVPGRTNVLIIPAASHATAP